MDNLDLELRREIARAERARLIIEDPLLVGAFEALDATYIAGWRDTRSDDTAGREALWHRIKALQMLRLDLNTALNDGAVAQQRLDELRAGTDQNP